MSAPSEYAFVTGAASGIGEAIVRELLGSGLTVAGMDLQVEKLAAIASEFPVQFVPIVADTTKEDDVSRAFLDSQRRLGCLKRAFNVVGGARVSTLLDHTLADWLFTTDLNLTSTFLCIREEARIMRSAGGAIVNVASLNAHIPAYGASGYSASKAAVEMLTKNAALELAQYGIRVNAILPGLTVTPSTTRSVLHNASLLAKYLERIPARRAAAASEIAKPAVFLASDAASYISGASLVVDGGWSTTTYPDLSAQYATRSAAPRKES